MVEFMVRSSLDSERSFKVKCALEESEDETMVHMSYAQWACLPSTYRNKVNPGSKAAQQGVREGDLISSINGRSTRELTNGEAHALLRNAGDQLKLGLNQENGSPKRRIYKSSLQENTSTIETIKKTTTKTTTTNTQIISKEVKKNGTNDTKIEPSYENQNGNLKTNSTSQQDDSNKKYKRINYVNLSSGELDYATDCESTSCLGIKMPCGSRSRRNRRNHQRKRGPRPCTPPKDGVLKNQLTGVIEEEPPADTSENDEEHREVNEVETVKKDTTIDGATLKITTERLCPEELPYLENMSTARSRLMRRNNRCKIEKKVMNTDTQICEITTIRNAEPLEARLDHIAGVGIVESSIANKERLPIENLTSTVTISEPAEPVQPLSEDLANKVENLPGSKECWTVAIPTKSPFDFLEIHEITDSEAEFDTSSNSQKLQPQGIISEAESDIEKDTSFEDSRKDESEDKVDDLSMSWEMEKQLRSFIEGLKLPRSPTEAASSLNASSSGCKLPESDVHSGGRDKPRNSVTKTTARKRATALALGSYQSQMSQESNRCLDIIQEEGETKCLDDNEGSSSSEQHIRDFINEEIGKYRREKRDLRSILGYEILRENMESKSAKTLVSESNREDESKTRLIEVDIGGTKSDDSMAGSSKKFNHEDKVDVVNCEDDCDIYVEKEKAEIENETFAQYENVETFINLVRSLKESIINEVNVDEIVSENYETSETKSSHESNNTVQSEKNTKIQKECSIESGKSLKLNKKESTHEEMQSNENAVLLEIEGNRKISEPEVKLVPESSLEEVVKDKNSECNNEVDLEEVVIHSVTHPDINNEITKTTNEIVQNGETKDKNNEHKISNRSSLNTNGENNEEVVYFVKSNNSSEKSENKKEFWDFDIVEDINSEEREDTSLCITEIKDDDSCNSISIDSISNKEEDVENLKNLESLKLQNKNVNKQSNEHFIPINIESIDISINKMKKRNEESNIPVKSENEDFPAEISEGLDITKNNGKASNNHSTQRKIPINVETIRSSTEEAVKSDDQIKDFEEEHIIPIKLDETATNSGKNINKILQETTKEQTKEPAIPVKIESTALNDSRRKAQITNKLPKQNEEKILPIKLENITLNIAENIIKKSQKNFDTTLNQNKKLATEEFEYIASLKKNQERSVNEQHKKCTIPTQIESAPSIIVSPKLQNLHLIEKQSKENTVPIKLENKTSYKAKNSNKISNETNVENLKNVEVIKQTENKISNKQPKERTIHIKMENTQFTTAKPDPDLTEQHSKERIVPISLEKAISNVAENIVEISTETIAENLNKISSKAEKEHTIPIKMEATLPSTLKRNSNQREQQNKERVVPIQLEKGSSNTVEKIVEISSETTVEKLENFTIVEKNEKKISSEEQKERTIPITVETTLLNTKKTDSSRTDQQSKECMVPIKLEKVSSNAVENIVEISAETIAENLNKVSSKEEKEHTTPIKMKATLPSTSKRNSNQREQQNKERMVSIQLEKGFSNAVENIIEISSETIIEKLENFTIVEKNEKKISSEEHKERTIPITIETSPAITTNPKTQDPDQIEKQHIRHIVPIKLEKTTSMSIENTVDIIKGERKIIQPQERTIPIKIEAKFSNTNIKAPDEANTHREERIVPIKLESKNLTKDIKHRIIKSQDNNHNVSTENSTNCKIAEENKNIIETEQTKERTISVQIKNISSNVLEHNSHGSDQDKLGDIHVVPVKLEGKSSTAADNTASQKNYNKNENITAENCENSKFIKENKNEQFKERNLPIKIKTTNLNSFDDYAEISPQTPNEEEFEIPIKSKEITSNNEEEILVPKPPKRSTSLRQPTIPEAPVIGIPVYVEKIPPPPPLRRQNIAVVHDSRYPPDFPFFTESAPKFAIFHQRALNAFEFEEQAEMVEFAKSLLTVLTNHESTRQDVLSFLSDYDLDKLPPHIRGIIDDLITSTPNLSSDVSTSSDGYADLCNELYEIVDAQRADNKIGIGEPVSLEIALTTASYYSNVEAPPCCREKFSEFTHTPLSALQELQVEGEIPSRLSAPLVQISGRRSSETTPVILECLDGAFELIKPKGESIVPTQFSCNAVTPTDFQGQQQQDSSSSIASLSTAKYNPAQSSVADISSISETPAEDSANAKPGTEPSDKSSLPRPKRKLLPLNGKGEEEEEEKEGESAISKAESPQPIPYSPVDDHLYYVPLGPANFGTDRNSDNVAKFSGDFPGSLKDLCIKKILSMPCGDQLISEISISKFNIFKSLNALQESLKDKELNVGKHLHTDNFKPLRKIDIPIDISECATYADQENPLEIEEMNRQKAKAWTGVPTKSNPKLLVCFSPAQQENVVKTSVDNLLDLHKKFINRRGYHHDHSHSISPPKYYVEVSPIVAPEPPIKDSKSSIRLLNIIKENPISAKSKPNGFLSSSKREKATSHDENHERLRATRLSDWLNLARYAPPTDNAPRPVSGDVLIECRSRETMQQREYLDKTQNGQEATAFERNTRHVNGDVTPIRNTTPTLCQSPVSFYSSSIIDKSCSNPAENKRSPTIIGRCGIDPWYINPALIIEDKPEVPPKVKKHVTVDRECIDTRSIFDQGPTVPRSKIMDSPDIKRVTAVKIMENLKELQAGMKDQMDKRKRYSLPQEYFDKQLKYIERLENQLKDAIIGEEEEKRVAEEFQKEMKRRRNKTRPYSVAESSFSENPFRQNADIKNKGDDCFSHKDHWKESLKRVDSNTSEFEKKEGSREVKQEVKKENGFYSKTSCEKIEKTEEHTVTTTSTVKKDSSNESKLKDFLRDLNDPKLDKVPTPSEPLKPSNDLKSHEESKKRVKMNRPVSIAAIPTNGEVFRKQMYDEYVHKVLEREERKHHKVIKLSSHVDLPAKKPLNKRQKDYSCLNKVEQEFIEKAQNRLSKFGIKLDESEAESGSELSKQQQIEAKFLVDGKEVKDARNLPKHLQEFLRLSTTEEECHDDEMIAPKFKASSSKPGVWSPGGDTAKPLQQPSPERGKDVKDEPIPPVWTPSSAGPSPVPERKEFRPVPFESPVLSRKNNSQPAAKADTASPPWQNGEQKKEASQVIGQSIPSRIVNSYSAPSQGLNALAGAPRLPRAQNPTITLLQKAREGQLPKGAAYLDETDHTAPGKTKEKPLLSPGEVIYALKKEYESEPETENAPPKKMADLGPRKYEGIGPTTKGGVPIVLRSEVKENNQAQWYKQMYDSLHRAPKNDDYVTIRYKPHRGTRTGYSGASSGYLSEPEPARCYSDRSSTLDNRRHRQRNKENDFSTSTLPRPTGRVDGHYSPDTYHMQPGRIEDYVPGNCSIQEKETKEPPSDLTWAKRKWWDEVMDIFDGWLDENGHLQSRGEVVINNAPLLQHSFSARPSLQSSALSAYLQQQQQQTPDSGHLSHSVSSSSNTSTGSSRPTSRSLRGPSPLGRLYSQGGRRTSSTRCNGKIRRDFELNEEQQRLRHTRLLESLVELAANGKTAVRPRSGSIGESERRIIRPLGGLDLDDDDDCWVFLGLAAAAPPSVDPRPRALTAVSARSRPQRQQINSNGVAAPNPSTNIITATMTTTTTTTTTTLSSSASSSSSVTNSSSNGTTTSTNHVAPFEQSRTHSPKSYMTHALKESGYESDSTLVFRRREDASPLSPLEQRVAYKTVQKGGDVPLHGLRKPAPERPKDDTQIEYFPISPTLTRIRVHRKSSCSSATASPASSTSSMTISRIPVSSMASRRSQALASKNNNSPLLRKTTAPNAANSCSLNGKVPSPPKRKSSRNNRTLKLYSNTAKSPENAQNNTIRHEQCFVEEQISNIRLLKEKLNSNLERHKREREELQKQRLIRTSSTSPVSLTRRPISVISLDSIKRRSEPCLFRSPIGSADTLAGRVKSRVCTSASPVYRSPKIPLIKKSTEIKSAISKTLSKTSIAGSSKDLRNHDKVCQHVSRSKTTNSSSKKEQKVRRTKKEQDESCKRLSRSTADLTSPVEVRSVLQRQKDKDRHPRAVTMKVLPSGTVVKSSSAPYTSTLGSSRLKLDEKSLKVTVAISPRGREILRKATESRKTTLSSKEKDSVGENSIDAKKRKIKDQSTLLQKSESKQSVSDMKTSKNKSRNKVSSRDSSKANSLERVKSSDRMTKSEASTPALTIDLLRQHHEATMSDSFFQHLFLRDILLTSTQANPLRRSSVLERARIFQEIGYSDSYRSEPSLKSLSIFLAHKRPVSNSRFKNWERESMSSRSSSPYGLRSPLSRINKYDSLLGVDEFGSSSSLRGRSPDLTRECPKERSLSEPPLKTLRESPDSSIRRSPSPSPIRAPSNRKIQSLRQDNLDNTSETSSKKSRAKSASEMDYIHGYQPNFGSNLSLTRSTSSLMNFPIDREDYQLYILERLHSKQKSKRYKDLYDFYTSLERMGKLEKTTSSGDLRPRLKNEEIIDYERWKQIRNKEKAEQELKNLYKKLKLVQKEKDFLFSTRDVDRYKWRGDSSLRCKERSVENIREQFRKLENQESELETLRQREIAANKDTYKPLWRGNSVVNIANTMTRKAAEKADFDRSSIQASLQRSLGGSNKFWSSLSIEQVTALKNQLNDIYGNDPVNPTKRIKTKRIDPPTHTPTVSVSNKIAESQKDQNDETIVPAKIQKKDTTISDSEQSSISVSDYEIVVPKLKKRDISPDEGLGLHVRCHSMIATVRPRREQESDPMKRSGSISRVSSLERSQSDRVPNSSPLSEGEKKRLSLTLGKEMLEKVSQKLTTSMIKPRETRGALAAALAKSTSSVSPRTCSSIDAPTSDDTSKFKERSDFVLVLTPGDDGPEQKEREERVMKEWAKKPPAVAITPPEKEGGDQLDSATESSDTSVHTVVRRSSECEDLQRKVEFYEKIEQMDKIPRSPKSHCKLSSSQSFADLKELFGESGLAKYRTLPVYKPHSRYASPAAKAEQMVTDSNNRGRSSSASPDVVASTRRPPRSCSHDRDEQQQQQQRPRSVSPYRVASPTDYCGYSSGSLESLWQRCGSPDPEKYWRTYLKLVHDGTVRRLRAKFESLEELSHFSRRRLALVPKRFQSDPELARNLLKRVTDTTKNYIKPQEIPDVAWLRRKYEPPRGRSRRGGVSPIPRIPWKLEDLTMPHINVISKTAELKESASRRTASSNAKEETKELEARRAVNRVREMFERSISPDSKTSILGEMFTSAPNVHELRDIAPYLAGRWVAHQYPSRYDNSRSLSSPPDLSRESETSSQRSKRSITPPSRKKRLASSRASSTSPVRPRTPGSILKQSTSQPSKDVFADQPFDPSKHRPRFRYQPPPPPLPLLPPPRVRYRTKPWCPPIPTYSARPTVVTFEGPDATKACKRVNGV